MFTLCCPHVCQAVDPAQAGVVGKWRSMACTLQNGWTSAFEYESVLFFFCSLICMIDRVSLWTNWLKALKDPETCKHRQISSDAKQGREIRPRRSGGGCYWSCVQFSKPAIVGRFCAVSRVCQWSDHLLLFVWIISGFSQHFWFASRHSKQIDYWLRATWSTHSEQSLTALASSSGELR